jgi:hypothetical protein
VLGKLGFSLLLLLLLLLLLSLLSGGVAERRGGVCPKPVNAQTEEKPHAMSMSRYKATAMLSASWVLPWRFCSSSDSPATLLQRSC